MVHGFDIVVLSEKNYGGGEAAAAGEDETKNKAGLIQEEKEILKAPDMLQLAQQIIADIKKDLHLLRIKLSRRKLFYLFNLL